MADTDKGVVASTNAGDELRSGPGDSREVGDTGSAAGDNLGVPGVGTDDEDATAANAPGGPDAGNTLGDTVGTGPAGGISDTRNAGKPDR